MKPVHNYIVVVDGYRAHYCHKRATAGRYRVGAHDEKQAEQLVRDIIGFGSVQTRCQCKDNDPLNVPYKTVVRETFDPSQKYDFKQEEAIHATSPRKERNE